MIEKITLQNYKCLRDVTLDLSPFTVLIGPNDSGKSSILDAIRVIGRPSTAMLVGGIAVESIEAWTLGAPSEIASELELAFADE